MRDIVLHAADAGGIMDGLAKAGFVMLMEGEPVYSGDGWDLTTPQAVHVPTGKMLESEGMEYPETTPLLGVYATLRVRHDVPDLGDLVCLDPPNGVPGFGPLPPAETIKAVHKSWLTLALLEIDKLDAVTRAVKANRAAAVLWDTATTIGRHDPEVLMIGAALGIDLDALFARADAIRASRSA